MTQAQIENSKFPNFRRFLKSVVAITDPLYGGSIEPPLICDKGEPVRARQILRTGGCGGPYECLVAPAQDTYLPNNRRVSL